MIQHVPTLTDVLASSSDALLPPARLLTLIRLELRGAFRIMALMGRGCAGNADDVGDPGVPTIAGRRGGGRLQPRGIAAAEGAWSEQ